MNGSGLGTLQTVSHLILATNPGVETLMPIFSKCELRLREVGNLPVTTEQCKWQREGLGIRIGMRDDRVSTLQGCRQVSSTPSGAPTPIGETTKTCPHPHSAGARHTGGNLAGSVRLLTQTGPLSIPGGSVSWDGGCLQCKLQRRKP